MARALMLQGTGSDVGKSCCWRALSPGAACGCGRSSRKTCRTTPRSPPMAARSAGRRPCRRAPAASPPMTDMNPVLLKPQSEGGGADRCCDGRVWGSSRRADYRRLAPALLPAVLGAFRRLAADADLVLVEGAGSPAEINLRAGDIANMGFAEAADVPVVLIGDIERGGVIAQLVGTHALLAAARASSARRLHRQQIPRRSAPVRRRHHRDRRSAPDCAALASCRISPPPHRCPPKIRWHSPLTLPLRVSLSPHAGRGQGARGRYRSVSPCRCCRASPISTISTRCGPSPGSSSSSCGRAGHCRAMQRW